MTENKPVEKPVAKKAAPAKSRREALAEDHPVARSGLSAVPQDVLNPAFAYNEELANKQYDDEMKRRRGEDVEDDQE